eukprot:609358-Prymnesium_polylepis.1
MPPLPCARLTCVLRRRLCSGPHPRPLRAHGCRLQGGCECQARRGLGEHREVAPLSDANNGVNAQKGPRAVDVATTRRGRSIRWVFLGGAGGGGRGLFSVAPHGICPDTAHLHPGSRMDDRVTGVGRFTVFDLYYGTIRLPAI